MRGRDARADGWCSTRCQCKAVDGRRIGSVFGDPRLLHPNGWAARMGMIHGRHLVSRSFVLLVILSTGPQRGCNRLHRKKGQKDQARTAPSLTSHSSNM